MPELVLLAFSWPGFIVFKLPELQKSMQHHTFLMFHRILGYHFIHQAVPDVVDYSKASGKIKPPNHVSEAKITKQAGKVKTANSAAWHDLPGTSETFGGRGPNHGRS